MRSRSFLTVLVAALTLASCSGKDQGIPVTELSGPWEFYPETFLDPWAPAPPAPQVLTVPGGLMKSSWGTYRRVVPIPPGWFGRPLWLHLRDVNTAALVFANGRLVTSAGVPAETAAGARPQNRNQIAALPEPGANLVLVIHVSNYENAQGGLVEAPLIGGPLALVNRVWLDNLLTWFLLGAFLFLAAYHAVLSWMERKVNLSFRFSVLMVFVILRLLLVPDFLYTWLDAFDVLIRIEYLSFYAIVPVFLVYFRGLYPQELPRSLVAAVAALALGLSLVTLTTPLLFTSSVLMPFYRTLTLAMAAVVMGVLVLALVRRREDSLLVAAAGFVLLACTVVEVSFYSRWVSSMVLTRIGLLLFIFCQSLLMARRHVRVLSRLETLNQDLETQVADRTRHLNEALVRLEEVSQSDPLTGLRNRRSFQSVLVPRLEALQAGFPKDGAFREKREGNPGPTRYAFLLLDIDHFKEVNDRYGHPAGDQVLRCFAGILAASVRQDDAVIRWGGEEFLVVLGDADGEGARVVAEKIRRRVEEAEFPLGEPGAATLRRTASVGIAAFPFDPLRPGRAGWSSVLGWADAALYEAKASGRNRAVAAAPGPRFPLWEGDSAPAAALAAEAVLRFEPVG